MRVCSFFLCASYHDRDETSDCLLTFRNRSCVSLVFTKDVMVAELDKAGVDDAVMMRYMWALMLCSMFDDHACT